jgi:hypothetical protein
MNRGWEWNKGAMSNNTKNHKPKTHTGVGIGKRCRYRKSKKKDTEMKHKLVWRGN